ncbi:conserved hypothetical protein [Tenacibaculum litopenaei]|uniref:hypothetical protein n=1 Tax=Tenacibaculum litopenaei TaxID=396016 RepID=UPI00389576A5
MKHPNNNKGFKNLTDTQTKERLNLYSKLGDHTQYFSIQNIKKEYESKQKEQQIKRTTADIYYAQRIRSGLPHPSHQVIQQQRIQEDKKLKTLLLNQAKTIYRKGENLSKWFHKGTEKSRSIPEKSITNQLSKSKGLGKYFNARVPVKPTINKNKEIHKDR